MAVIGSTLGLPSVQDVVSLKVLFTVFIVFLIVGTTWLIIDYGRMLMLYRKMVRRYSISPAATIANLLTATWPFTLTNRWKHLFVARKQAMDILRTTFEDI